MPEKMVRLIKIDVGSPSDRALQRVGRRLRATRPSVIVRQSLAITDRITQAQSQGRRVLVETTDGAYDELVLG